MKEMLMELPSKRHLLAYVSNFVSEEALAFDLHDHFGILRRDTVRMTFLFFLFFVSFLVGFFLTHIDTHTYIHFFFLTHIDTHTYIQIDR